jgi:hypothetical protein
LEGQGLVAGVAIDSHIAEGANVDGIASGFDFAFIVTIDQSSHFADFVEDFL